MQTRREALLSGLAAAVAAVVPVAMKPHKAVAVEWEQVTLPVGDPPHIQPLYCTEELLGDSCVDLPEWFAEEIGRHLMEKSDRLILG